MISNAFVALLMVLAGVHYCISKTVYLQSATSPANPCSKIDCQPSKEKKNDLECTVYQKINNQNVQQTFTMEHVQGNTYRIPIMSIDFREIKVVITKKAFITKFFIQVSSIHGTNSTTACAANRQKITNGQKNRIKKFCNEKGMKFIDNSNC